MFPRKTDSHFLCQADLRLDMKGTKRKIEINQEEKRERKQRWRPGRWSEEEEEEEDER